MRITVFGATGGVGRQVVRQALDRGHSVVAVVRDPARLPVVHPHLEVAPVRGLTDPEPLCALVRDSEAVVSGVGPGGRRNADRVATTSTRAILRALDGSPVRRLVVVSAAPVGPVPDGEGLLGRYVLTPLVGRALRPVYVDLAEMESEIARSSVPWTVVRPPKLLDRPLTASYRRVVGGNVPRGHWISRADTAHAMLGALDDPATVDRHVGVAH